MSNENLITNIGVNSNDFYITDPIQDEARVYATRMGMLLDYVMSIVQTEPNRKGQDPSTIVFAGGSNLLKIEDEFGEHAMKTAAAFVLFFGTTPTEDRVISTSLMAITRFSHEDDPERPLVWNLIRNGYEFMDSYGNWRQLREDSRLLEFITIAGMSAHKMIGEGPYTTDHQSWRFTDTTAHIIEAEDRVGMMLR